jgi:transposase
MRPRCVQLEQRQRHELKRRLRGAKSAPLRRRLTVLKLSDEGLPMARIARLLGCSVGTVSNDLDRFERGGFAGVEPKPVGGSKPKVTEAHLVGLEQALSRPPGEHGYALGSWTLALMARHLQQVIGAPAISLSCLRRRLLARGWRRLRPRISIIRRDPKREEKLAAIEAQKGGSWQRTRRP